MDFWTRIKDEISFQKTTQKDIASELGINLQTLRNAISQNRLPDLESAYKIAKKLGQPLEYFMDGNIFSSGSFNLPARESALLENYRKLSDIEKDAMDSAVKILSAAKK